MMDDKLPKFISKATDLCVLCRSLSGEVGDEKSELWCPFVMGTHCPCPSVLGAKSEKILRNTFLQFKIHPDGLFEISQVRGSQKIILSPAELGELELLIERKNKYFVELQLSSRGDP